MTLGEFRVMAAGLPDDTVIFIKGQDEYTRADHYGVGVKDVLISSGCDRIDLADAADFDTVGGGHQGHSTRRLGCLRGSHGGRQAAVADLKEMGWEYS